jgi:DNA-binding NarL/FixJ family response regulator
LVAHRCPRADLQYLDYAAKFAFIVNSNNCQENVISHKQHILLLAITIGHCLHYSLVRTWWERQNAKDGIETVRNLDWENSVFGGHVVFFSDGGSLSTAIQGMEGQARHFIMSDDDITAIVDGEYPIDGLS